MTKRCFKCGLVQPLDDFYVHPQMADGHLGKCKTCTKADVKSYRTPEKERARNRLPHRKAQKAEMQRRHRARYPEKYAARQAVNNAVRDGRLHRLPCERCGSLHTEAHHPDYTKPLDVVWLCFACHRAEHGHTVARQDP